MKQQETNTKHTEKQTATDCNKTVMIDVITSNLGWGSILEVWGAPATRYSQCTPTHQICGGYYVYTRFFTRIVPGVPGTWYVPTCRKYVQVRVSEYSDRNSFQPMTSIFMKMCVDPTYGVSLTPFWIIFKILASAFSDNVLGLRGPEQIQHCAGAESASAHKIHLDLHVHYSIL